MHKQIRKYTLKGGPTYLPHMPMNTYHRMCEVRDMSHNALCEDGRGCELQSAAKACILGEYYVCESLGTLPQSNVGDACT